MEIQKQNSFRRMNFRICLAIILLSCLVAACSGPVQTSREDTEPLPTEALRTEEIGSFGGSVRYSQAGEPGSFNPVLATNVRDLTFGRLLHAYLFEFDPIERKMRGGVVLKSERSEGGGIADLDSPPGGAFLRRLTPDFRSHRLDVRENIRRGIG